MQINQAQVLSSLFGTGMKVYPRHQLRPRFLGEAKVYDLLSRVPAERAFGVHSVNLPEHEYKRWGEADFVVVSNSGVTLLEVKGGLVSIAGKEWRYENARGQAIVSTEGPARQAVSAAAALERLLTNHIGRKIRCRWGVVFPLCSFRKGIAELPPNRLADIHTCNDDQLFKDWLDNIPFDQYQAADFALVDDEVLAVHEIIVPVLSAAESLGLTVRAAQQEIIRLTDQQFETLESLEVNSRLCITGGAGTGKTELACLCARAEKAAGRRPVIVTTGKPLFLALKARMSAFGIPVASETLPSGTDVLIVDEGQDYAQPSKFESLFAQLPGGLSAGRWRWFMDPNLQFTENPPAHEYLIALAENAPSVMLNRNVRSTREIVDSIRVFLNADIGTSKIDGFGIRVSFHSVESTAAEIATVQKLVTELLEEGIQPSEIALLGASGAEGPVCAGILRLMPDVFRTFSIGGGIQSAVHGLVSGISEFRGLEARVVLLTDMHPLPIGGRGESLLYIGMTRATASLYLLVSPEFSKDLTALVKKSFD